jgi:hypothetical protein
MKKIMINTDVLIDLLEQKTPEYKSIAQILSEKNKLKIKVFFSSLTFQEVCKYKSPVESREIMRRIFMLGKVIGTVDKAVEKALYSPIDELEYSLQYYTADDHHMDYFISNYAPKKHWKKLPVLSADQFLNVIK